MTLSVSIDGHINTIDRRYDRHMLIMRLVDSSRKRMQAGSTCNIEEDRPLRGRKPGLGSTDTFKTVECISNIVRNISLGIRCRVGSDYCYPLLSPLLRKSLSWLEKSPVTVNSSKSPVLERNRRKIKFYVTVSTPLTRCGQDNGGSSKVPYSDCLFCGTFMRPGQLR